jgi:hypothetical protein
MIIFPDLPDIEVEGVEVAEEITLTLRTTSPTLRAPPVELYLRAFKAAIHGCCAICPPLGIPSGSFSLYVVFSANLSTCAQKIFVERLPDLCSPHAQRTKRLQEALRRLGLSMGGKIGADVGSDHGINGSRDTILRLVHQSELSAQSEPHVIGLDDWAWKRRMR